jgi:hypothetical protein
MSSLNLCIQYQDGNWWKKNPKMVCETLAGKRKEKSKALGRKSIFRAGNEKWINIKQKGFLSRFTLSSLHAVERGHIHWWNELSFLFSVSINVYWFSQIRRNKQQNGEVLLFSSSVNPSEFNLVIYTAKKNTSGMTGLKDLVFFPVAYFLCIKNEFFIG